ncbi:ATP-grasp domain-containing protein [Candidatus Dojkabacteria bacterium]|uniref:ATP-grasp domain-containing protein n=1 Tax=Candidatus Dojkabacteria bacterium TaxID=2099670 RepID=A0A955I842_9BACT|nr:ATP-grasp domain-containing protein [Candidatus Dojkabacteria bacterium]
MRNRLQDYTNNLNSHLSDKNLYYFVRNPERGLGLETLINNYYLIYIQSSQYSEYFNDGGIKNYCLECDSEIEINPQGGTRILLSDQKVLNFLDKNKKKLNYAQTFKVNPAYEKKVQELGFNTLNTTSLLNREFEEKITQYQNLSQLVKFPKTILDKFGNLSYLQLVHQLGQTFVIQFARGHTGSGTYVIDTEEEFNSIQAENDQRFAKFSAYVSGIAYTINACVTNTGVFMGGLSLQITGDQDLGALWGTTIGNDWSKRINLDNTDQIMKETEIIGSNMYKKGFRGMFGVDFIVKENGETFVIEINARQTASVPMYTKMQLLRDEVPLSLLHLYEFMGLKIDLNYKEYNLQNLQTENFSQISNRADKQITIKHCMKMGIYRLQGDNAAQNRFTDEIAPTTVFLDEDRDKALLYQKYATNVASMDRQGVLVLTPIKDRILNQGDEIVRLQLNQNAIDSQGNTIPWIKEALISIKEHQL